MSGIAGFTLPSGISAEERKRHFGTRLQRMVASLRHRGPDAQRALLLEGIALGHTRLATHDLSHGVQPLRDAETGVAVVMQGPIFNADELRAELLGARSFHTRSDAEVLLAGFLARGIDFVKSLNAQLAFAIWDPRSRELWLGRDRIGLAPLFYTLSSKGLAFASEAKALFAGGHLEPELDLRALAQALRYGGPVAGNTAFTGVRALPPATLARYADGHLTRWRYWDLPVGRNLPPLAEDEAGPALAAALEDAIRLRLRADVAVGGLLDGDVDSGYVGARANAQLGGRLRTFSVSHAAAGDETRRYQTAVVSHLGTAHRLVELAAPDLGALLPAAVWHGEQLVFDLRAAPAYLAGRLVHDSGVKVALCGDGASELFLGSAVFREAQLRAFCARQPGSSRRTALLASLWPEPIGRNSSPAAWDFSHGHRWEWSEALASYLAPGARAALASYDPDAELATALPASLERWSLMDRAQYLELGVTLPAFGATAIAERMLLANGVEARFPYLDHRVIELAARIPHRLKLRGLRDKRVLRHIARRELPRLATSGRPARVLPPLAEVLLGARAPEWTHNVLDRQALERGGLLDAESVQKLVARVTAPDMPASRADAAALAFVASTQLLAEFYGAGARFQPQHVRRVALEA